jgi:hypothetical protein
LLIGYNRGIAPRFPHEMITIPPLNRIRAARSGVSLAASLFLLISNLAAKADEYDRLEAATERWVDLEKRIAEERNSWKAQKGILEQRVLALEAGLEELNKSLENLDEASGIRQDEIQNYDATLAELEETRAFYVEKLEALELQFVQFREKGPDFLDSELETASEKLEVADPAALGERAQIMIAAFTRIEEFNRTVTIDYVPRELEDGREVMVSVLYWGLARAYAVDPQGTIAWELEPGPEGWEWIERRDSIAPILELVRIYEQLRPPSLQVVPAKVTQRAEGETNG